MPSPQSAPGWIARRCSHTPWRQRETPLFADKERGIPALQRFVAALCLTGNASAPSKTQMRPDGPPEDQNFPIS
jgi:hypothetical protein